MPAATKKARTNGLLGQIILGPIMIVVALLIGTHLLAEMSPIPVRDWGKTTGTVLEHGTVVDPRGTNPMYGPMVVYSYEVNGHPHTSDRVYLNRDHWRGTEQNRRQVSEINSRYPLGSQVTVWYDRASPSTAVLERTVRQPAHLARWAKPLVFLGMVAVVALGGYLLIGGSLALVRGPRQT
jgi:hypothetical protein